MAWSEFWRDFQTQELHWLADQVRQADPSHPLHLDPAGLLANLTSLSDDLPTWRIFLDTLGCSIHPAWHFSLIPHDEYGLGVSFINDLVRGSIAPKPYWVMELQGGNNISSGGDPMDPTAAETRQWIWTSLSSGAQRIIFWLLNARNSGGEAGEWSLLDFEQRPSERLVAAAEIAAVLQANASFFFQCKAGSISHFPSSKPEHHDAGIDTGAQRQSSS